MEQESNNLVEQIANLSLGDIKEDQNVEEIEDPFENIKFPSFLENESTEIVFYDVETTIPGVDVIEFGAVILDKKSLFVKEKYSSLIHSTKITKKSIECNGITLDMVKDAPTFDKIADKVFEILNGRIWGGHNIISFDNRHIVKEFKKLKKNPPKPSGLIDTLPLLRNSFGTRAGNMKMESLGLYFNLGKEKHRALEDCEMTIQVFKNCCMTLFLEKGVEGIHIDSSKKKARKKSIVSTPITAENNDVNTNTPNTTPLKSTKSTKSILINQEFVDKINKSIENKSAIWISYNGGTIPLVPRKLTPVKWLEENKFISALLPGSQTEHTFTFTKIVEIRNEKWKLEVITPTK